MSDFFFFFYIIATLRSQVRYTRASHVVLDIFLDLICSRKKRDLGGCTFRVLFERERLPVDFPRAKLILPSFRESMFVAFTAR